MKETLRQLYAQGWLVEPETFAPSFRYYEVGLSSAGVDLATLQHILATQQNHFLDLHFQVKKMVAEEFQIAVYWQAVGTPIQSFETHPPSGQSITWQGVTIWHVQSGTLLAGETVAGSLIDY